MTSNSRRRSGSKSKPVDPGDIDVLIGLNYYTPYVSGLTNVARDVAEFLANQGLKVVVVTTQHDASLPRRELMNGVTVIRTKVLGRVDRAPISPGFVRTVIRLGRRSRLVNLHLPMPEAGAIALGVGKRAPIVLTYQCDPPKGLNAKADLVQRALDVSHRVAVKRAAKVIASSLDYASSSRLLGALSPEQLIAIPPPSWPRPPGNPSFRSSTGRHVGFLGRLTSEKGADVLIRAFRQVAAQDDRLLIAGEGAGVAGDSAFDTIASTAENDPRVIFLGRIDDAALADFYASIDVFCLPSTNSFEAFGIVQVEALLAGVPVIASDLPGVRTPVRLTHGGVTATPGDADSLANALVATEQQTYNAAEIAKAAQQIYGIAGSLTPYRDLFDSLSNNSQANPPSVAN